MARDAFQRDINYLRISLTDHCNLRCAYCMALDSTHFAPEPDLLAAEEIELVVRAAVGVGFHKFRLTGGEPTLRADLVEIVSRIAGVPGVRDIALTTNAILLPRLAPALAAAGLRRVNVHLDTLNPARLRNLMRWGRLEAIWAGIEAAERAGLVPIKLNAVVTRGFNDEDVVDLARLAVERAWHIRFIELMPFGGGECARLARDRFVPTAETLALIAAALGPLDPLAQDDPSDEARVFRPAGAAGTVGFISPVSAPYCGTCNRMRLTADGKFHLCLLHDDEIDVRHLLRNGASIADLQDVLNRAVTAKPTGHGLAIGVHTRNRKMHQIGG